MPAQTAIDFTTAEPNVFNLMPDEPISFDPDRLSVFCNNHGIEAENEIAKALFQIEERLLLAAWQVETNEIKGLRRSAEMLLELAEPIGMVTLEQAASAVCVCLDRGDPAALAACAARLARLSDYGKLGDWNVLDGGVA